jgi:hypothetical protein
LARPTSIKKCSLSIRWYSRRPGWRIPLRHGDPVAFEKLIAEKFLIKFDTSYEIDFDEILKILNKSDLENIAKNMLIDKKHRKTMDLLKAKLISDYKTNTKSAFKGALSPSERLLKNVRKQIEGKRYKIDNLVQKSINLLFLTYSPTICSSVESGDPHWKLQTYLPSLGESFIQNIRRFGESRGPCSDIEIKPTLLIYSKTDLQHLYKGLVFITTVKLVLIDAVENMFSAIRLKRHANFADFLVASLKK